MGFLGIVLAATLSGPAHRLAADIEPTLWLHPSGRLLIQGQPVAGRLTSGARTTATPFGLGLDLNGTQGGLLLGDASALRLTRSLTLSTWVYLRAYVTSGPGAQILFRGDDRPGYDPYALVVEPNGTVAFRISEADNYAVAVDAEIPLRTWVHVDATLDADTDEMRLWIDDRLVATRATTRRPFAALEPEASPGIGIGNVQHEFDNEPLNGVLADLRVYDRALEPADTGYRPYRQTP